MAWPKGKPRGPKPAAPQSEVQEEIAAMPKPEVLGTIKPGVLREDVASSAKWVSADGTVVDLSAPPPWAVEAQRGAMKTDARVFVDVPEDWVLRWMSPKLIDQRGYNGWLPLSTSDERVRVKVTQMRSPDNLVRRGYGNTSDILVFMPRHWYERRMADKAAYAQRMAASGREKQQQFSDNIRRGKFGPFIKPGFSEQDSGFKTPAATQFDGRAMAAADRE